MAKSRRVTRSVSPAVKSARERNHLILRLRGMYASLSSMRIGYEQVFEVSEIILGQQIIDQALSRLGAETESDRQRTWLEKRREAGAI